MPDHPIKPCQVCGIDFKPIRTTSKVCSTRCQNLMKYQKDKKSVSCVVCGKDFITVTATTCSNECTVLFRTKLKPAETKKCIICGIDFESRRKDSKYCSDDCLYKYAHQKKKTIEKVCLCCNKTFVTSTNCSLYCSPQCVGISRREIFVKNCETCGIQYETNREEQRFCSSKCFGQNMSNNTEKLFHTCPTCGEVFQADRKTRVYCSVACVPPKKTHEEVTIICKECGKDFKRRFIHRHKKFCSKSCRTIRQNKIMFSPENSTIREKISITQKKKYASGHKHPWTGRKHTQETKDKISKEHIESGRHKGEKNPTYGGHTQETKEKISRILKEKILDGKVKWKVRGEVVFFKKAQKQIYVRSSWEKLFAECIDNDENIVDANYECIAVKYYYGQARNYFPDFLLTYKDGTKKLIEIKPSCYVEAEINIQKFSSARKYCEENSMIFEVWTERDNPYGILKK